MSNSSPEELIKEVLSFIKKERELYGNFSIKPSQKEHSTKEGPEGSSLTYYPKDTNDPDPIYDEIAKCSTLKELEKLCQKAEILKTDLENTRLVFGGGNPDADLMLIGEAPGAEENKTGRPFVGRAGKLLDKILKAINFDRNDIYIGNILKHRPPNNRNPLPEERVRSLPFLERQVDLVNPKLILALGKVSAQTLLDNNMTLTKMRGTFYNYRERYPLLVTYHPAALLRNPNWKRPTWEDVQLLKKRYDELGGQP